VTELCRIAENVIRIKQHTFQSNSSNITKYFLKLSNNIYNQNPINNHNGKEHYILHKIDNKSPFENIPKLYYKALEIKAAKFKDVQKLAVKYVPSEHMWFYR
jgi:hypothetical protein